jgi:hypothetical protein
MIAAASRDREIRNANQRRAIPAKKPVLASGDETRSR